MSDTIPLTDLDAPAGEENAEQLELASIHDFATKLVQPGSKEALEHYVRWQVALRNAEDADATELDPDKVPDFAPISINLDLTTACNYACDHCVDLDILNTGIRFDHDKLRSLVSDKTKLFYMNTPQNPTGGVLTIEDLEFIAELARKHNFYVMSDEIYNRFVYEGKHASILHVPEFLDQTIMLDGHSKTYAMTGWRLGFSISSEEMAKHLTLLMTNSTSCTAAFTQVAGEEALLGEQQGAEEIIQRFKERRSVIVDGLNSIPGVSCRMPTGAFYAFPNVKEYTEKQGRTSQELQRWLLHEHGIACLAGTCFGPNGEGYLRFSYANSTENINRALERLREAFAQLA